MKLTRKLIGLAAALGLSVVLAGCGYNTIPTQDQAVKASWANVQAAYQRRADLIPNLVNTVAAYAKQEQTVLIAVTQARASATQVKVDASTITDPVAAGGATVTPAAADAATTTGAAPAAPAGEPAKTDAHGHEHK